jgi:hypothetical protein
VLYRPLPIESRSPQEILTGIEGVVLLVWSIRGARRIGKSLRRSRRRPYIIYAVGATIAGVVVLSGLSNFGLLARERAVIEPMMLAILAMPAEDAVVEAQLRPWLERQRAAQAEPGW